MAGLDEILASGSDTFRRLNQPPAGKVRPHNGGQAHALGNLARALPVAVPQPDRPKALDRGAAAKKRSKVEPTRRLGVQFHLFRVRLLDRDNMYSSVKYMLDSLRYAGLIANDTEEDIELKVEQHKVSKASEGTGIVITYRAM